MTEALGTEFVPLQLPAAPLQFKRNAQGQTLGFDRLRRRWIRLTPEEWVRQHFVHFLIAGRGFPPALLANEVGIDIGGSMRRCDTVLFDRNEARPRVIVEYKAPQVAITEPVFRQIESYNAVLKADWLIVSNGLQHFVCRIDYATRSSRFVPDIPQFADL